MPGRTCTPETWACARGATNGHCWPRWARPAPGSAPPWASEPRGGVLAADAPDPPRVQRNVGCRSAELKRTQRCPRQWRSEEHTSELQSRFDLVCRLLLEKKKKQYEDILR